MRIIIVIGLVALLIHQQAHSIDALRLFTTSSFATSVNKVKGSTILAHHSTTTSSSHRKSNYNIINYNMCKSMFLTGTTFVSGCINWVCWSRRIDDDLLRCFVRLEDNEGRLLDA